MYFRRRESEGGQKVKGASVSEREWEGERVSERVCVSERRNNRGVGNVQQWEIIRVFPPYFCENFDPGPV